MLRGTQEEIAKANKEAAIKAVKLKQTGITPVQPRKDDKGIFG